ncbi:MAG TPA: hypothetical protein VJT69_01065 [Pyrinomonadaceae bacterium]|nr:hypothetical protein [Pyrinomonadaceae bacterium]
MRTPITLISVLTGLFVIASLMLLSQPVSMVAADVCCIPPESAAARFPQDAEVTVHLNTTGLTSDEVKAIKTGIEGWNNTNNSGVKFIVKETTNPPPPGANNTIVAYFINESGTVESAIDMHSGTTGIWGELKFWNRIRSGTPSLLAGFLRSTARHEAGHALGLENADDCPEGSTIMNPSRQHETFITPCDINRVNSESAYPSPEPTLNPGGGGLTCQYNDEGCEDCVPDDGLEWQNCKNLESQWLGIPYCRCLDPSPILVDTLGNGFDLTSRADGVMFDINNDGTKNQIPWTTALTDDGWLCLDRDGNGTIDNGTELFGNFTPQLEPPSEEERNGFLALAEYDRAANGGNGDGLITDADAVFNSLRLWQDINHNGFSELTELLSLQTAGIKVLELEYKTSKYTDQFGNQFRYRTKIKDTNQAQTGRWAWDVFLVAGP